MKNRIVTIFVALGISILGISVISCKFLSSIPILDITPEATAAATLSPLEARAGVWQGTTEFGSFTFEVSPDGKTIVDLTLHYKTGDNVVLEGDITLSDSSIQISEKNSFELNSPNFVFTAKFSKDGTSASGRWEMISPIKASENWKLKDHQPDFALLTPVSTQAINTQLPDQALPNGVETQATKLEDITGVWLETFPGGTAHLEIRSDGVTIFKIISGANKGYQDQGQYWFENGELRVKTEGLEEIGRYKVYVTRQDGMTTQIRYEVIADSYDARRDAIIYAPLMFLESASEVDPELTLLPLDILGCNPVSECPESAVSIRSFFEENEELQNNTEYPVYVSTDTEVRFFTGWCTLEQELLEENLKHIEFVFKVDGVSFADQLAPNTFTEQDQSDSTKINYCHTVGGVVDGWQKEHAYQIVFGMKFTDSIFDGWDTYEPGDYTYIYLVSVEP